MSGTKGGIVGAIAITPATIDVAGFEVGVLSLVLGITSVLLTQGVITPSSFAPANRRLAVNEALLAVLLLTVFVIEANPGPGLAVFSGIGVGVSIKTLIAVAGTQVVARLRALFGVKE